VDSLATVGTGQDYAGWACGIYSTSGCSHINEHRSALRGTSRFGFAGVPNAPNIELGLFISTRSESGCPH